MASIPATPRAVFRISPKTNSGITTRGNLKSGLLFLLLFFGAALLVFYEYSVIINTVSLCRQGEDFTLPQVMIQRRTFQHRTLSAAAAPNRLRPRIMHRGTNSRGAGPWRLALCTISSCCPWRGSDM